MTAVLVIINVVLKVALPGKCNGVSKRGSLIYVGVIFFLSFYSIIATPFTPQALDDFAMVACRMLGRKGDVGRVGSSARLPYVMRNVQCVGSEDDVTDCVYDDNRKCDSKKSINLICGCYAFTDVDDKEMSK